MPLREFSEKAFDAFAECRASRVRKRDMYGVGVNTLP
mgnify:CR=1 FL=1